MPMDVTMPDGTTITGVPDGTTKAQLQAKYAGHLATQTQPTEQPNPAVDAIRSIPGGVAKGVSAIAGFPGDMASLQKGNLPPAEPNESAPVRILRRIDSAIQPSNVLPKSSTMANAAGNLFGGYYKPQTTAGKYAETIASFAPAALAPGGAVTRASRVVLPGAASEAAGQATEGTPYEPYARAAAGIVAGGVQGLGEGVMAERRATAATPTSNQLKASSGAMYSDMDAKNLNIAGKSYDNAVDQIKSDLASRGFNPRIPPEAVKRLYPKASAALETLQAAKGGDIGLADLDKLRQTARVALSSGDKADRGVAHAIIDGLDDFVNGLKPADITSGDPSAVASLNEARALWARSAKADTIQRTIQKAEDSASTYTGAGKENAYRVQFRNLSKNETAMRQFSPDEQDAIRKVAAGGPVENVLRFVGKFSPHGGLMTLATGGAGFAAGGPVGAAGALAAGEAARQGATMLTARNARLASELVRSNGTTVPQLAPPIARNAYIAGILSGPRNIANDDYASRVNDLASRGQQ